MGKHFSYRVVQSQSGSKKNVKAVVKDHQGKTIAK